MAMKKLVRLGLPGTAALVGLGLVLALGAGVLGSATGQELKIQSEPSPRRDYACRVFPWNTADGQGGYFESSDRTGPIGAWLGPLTDSGWVLDHFDYEVGQKATGFPEPTLMVCVRRDRANAD